jgi:3-oxoacyl-[acyl-carrier protein] reductase
MEETSTGQQSAEAFADNVNTDVRKRSWCMKEHGSSLDGKVAIVTGGSLGLGREITLAYLNEGARVAFCGREESAVRAASHALLARGFASERILAEVADVASDASVDEFIKNVTSWSSGRIDILVNNAGVSGPIEELEQADWQHWLSTIEINLLGSVRMCRAVIPVMKSLGWGKIIQISGGGATKPMPRFSAYAASKAAIVRCMETLAQEVAPFGIQVNSLAPGALNTRFLTAVLDAGPDKAGQSAYDSARAQQRSGGTELSVPARLAVFLASSASDGITGKLISAVWDHWERFPDFTQDLSSSDVYTLRRITGRERGLQWSDK